MGKRKTQTLTVDALRLVLAGLPGSLPIVIVGEHQRVVGAEVVYQGKFTNMDPVNLYMNKVPVAVALQLMPI